MSPQGVQFFAECQKFFILTVPHGLVCRHESHIVHQHLGAPVSLTSLVSLFSLIIDSRASQVHTAAFAIDKDSVEITGRGSLNPRILLFELRDHYDLRLAFHYCPQGFCKSACERECDSRPLYIPCPDCCGPPLPFSFRSLSMPALFCLFSGPFLLLGSSLSAPVFLC